MVDSRKRIAGAFLIGGALVAVAFVMGSQKGTSGQEGSVVAATIERSHINIRDTDNNGIPDWRDALKTTQPIVLNEATSTYEKPKTVTGRFALDFLKDMFRSKMYGSFGASPEELVADATTQLAEAAEDILFTEKDITTIEAQSEETLKAYGNHVAEIALSSVGGEENEVLILQDALRYNEPDRLQGLDPIAGSYAEIVERMLQTPVPARYVKEHLDLLNTYNALLEDVLAMQKVYDDALYTFVRMKRYQDDVLGMRNAIAQLYDALYLKDNVQWQENEPASALRAVIDTI